MTLDEMEALEKAATPGPWLVDGPCVTTVLGKTAGWPPSPEAIASLDDGEYIENKNAERDAAFIAAARTYLPKLLAVARAAKAHKKLNDLHAEFGEPVDGHYEAWLALAEALAALEASP